MPEPTVSAAASTETAVSSTPVDTESIARSVINNAEAGEGNEEVVAQPDQAGEAAREAARQAQIDPDDFDQVQPETTDALGRKIKNKIPHERVGVMIGKKVAAREKELISQVAKELGITKAEAELTLDDVLGNVRESGSKYKVAEERVQIAEAVEAIMEQDGDRFIKMLAEANPQMYGKFLKVLEAVEQAQAAEDLEPEPDYDMGNGQKTYSLDGMRKRDEWRDKQTEKRILAQMDQRLSPYEKERKAREQKERIAEIHTQATDALNKTLDRASKWPGFLDNQEAIAKLIVDNPQLELVDAYMQVVPTKLAADRTKMRAELIAEVNSEPHSTSVQVSPAAAKKTTGPKTTEDFAREAIAQFST